MAGAMGCMDPFKKGCDRVKKVRGCCITCYGVLKKQVVTGKATWAEHEAAGLCLVKKTRAEMNEAARRTFYGKKPGEN